jgi:hypothetical protein
LFRLPFSSGVGWVIGVAIAIWLPGTVIATATTLYAKVRGNKPDFVADLVAPTFVILAGLFFLLPLPFVSNLD